MLCPLSRGPRVCGLSPRGLSEGRVPPSAPLSSFIQVMSLDPRRAAVSPVMLELENEDSILLFPCEIRGS